jgi:hypothetical protein
MRGDRFRTERVSMSTESTKVPTDTDKQPAYSMETEDNKSGRIGDSKIWSRVPRDSDTRVTALVKAGSSFKRPTHPLVRESVPYQQTRNCLTVIKA